MAGDGTGDGTAAAQAAFDASTRYMQARLAAAYGFPPAGGGRDGAASSTRYMQARLAAIYGFPPAGGGRDGAVSSMLPAGWSPGCTCSSCLGLSPSSPLPTPGMGGFGEEGPEDFAAGTLAGYRWWGLPAPDFRRDPLTADSHWPVSLLRGQRAEWQPGVNEAVCLAGPGAHEEPLPAKSCGCGVWAYNSLKQHNLGGGQGSLPVAGVVEGWGRSRTGSLGFRCAKARILALCLQFEIQPYRHQGGWYDVSGSGYAAQVPAEDADRLECWMAVIEDRLAQTYPGVRMYSVQKAMLARFPLRS